MIEDEFKKYMGLKGEAKELIDKASEIFCTEMKVADEFAMAHKSLLKDAVVYIPMYGASNGMFTAISSHWYAFGIAEVIHGRGEDTELRQSAIDMSDLVLAMPKNPEDIKTLMKECAERKVPFVIFAWIEGTYRVYIKSADID